MKNDICACLLLLLLAAPASASPPDKPLLPQATRVIAVTPEWGVSPLADGLNGAGHGGVAASWLSGRELLHADHGVLCRYDTTSHTDTALPALQRQVATSSSFYVSFDASPDARWVLWGQGSGSTTLYAAPVDGSGREQSPDHGGRSECFWCADSHHWLQFLLRGPTPRDPFGVYILRARLHDVNHPRQAHTLAVPPGLRGLDVLAAVSMHAVVARTPDAVRALRPSKSWTKDDGVDVLAALASEETFRATQRISVWDLDAPRSLHEYTVRLDAPCSGMAVSPQGDRAAWLLNRWRGKSLSVSLWVSGLDGSGLHEVGEVPCGPHPEYQFAPHDLKWLPGGRKISFTYNGALWMVPAQ